MPSWAMADRSDTSRIAYATASAAAVANLVHDRSGLPPGSTRALLDHGCDCYAVVPPAGTRFVLRPSCHCSRGDPKSAFSSRGSSG